MDATQLKKLKVQDLRDKLTELNLPTTGKKEDLIARLLEAPATAGQEASSSSSSSSSVPSQSPAVTTSSPVSTEAAPVSKASGDTSASPVPGKETEKDSESTLVASSIPAPVTAESSNVQQKSKEEELLERARKMEERAKRFGLPVPEDARKMQRAARFGLPLGAKSPATNPASSGGKKEAHPEKRGNAGDKKVGGPMTASTLGVSTDKLNKRAERFGITKPSPSSTAAGSTNSKRSRMEASPVDEAEAERRRKRAERFGTTASAPTTTAPRT
ncbi:MAG: hypothetical protein DHS80DRAFT_31693 [Piptocephalis tieghemiana]|nr:MAG: hypothetical protein DHS80DRAFT_31693 [Piptocephalis tieghemiana]